MPAVEDVHEGRLQQQTTGTRLETGAGNKFGKGCTEWEAKNEKDAPSQREQGSYFCQRSKDMAMGTNFLAAVTQMNVIYTLKGYCTSFDVEKQK